MQGFRSRSYKETKKNKREWSDDAVLVQVLLFGITATCLIIAIGSITCFVINHTLDVSVPVVFLSIPTVLWSSWLFFYYRVGFPPKQYETELEKILEEDIEQETRPIKVRYLIGVRPLNVILLIIVSVMTSHLPIACDIYNFIGNFLVRNVK